MTGIRKGGSKTPRKGRQPALRVVATDGQRVGTEGKEAAPCGPEGQAGAPERKPKTRGPILPGIGVTAKEEAFCQAVADGCSQSEAYRRSHEARDMLDTTLWQQAIKVGARDRVRRRIEVLLQGKQRETLHDRARALSWALTNLQKMVEADATSDAARVQAMALVMRHHALLTDKQEVDTYDHRGADELASELRERIERLLAPQPKVA